MTENETIGERLRRLRKEAGLTQAELAAQVGLSQSAIGNIEAGTRGYGASVILIAKTLKTQPEFLQGISRVSRGQVLPELVAPGGLIQLPKVSQTPIDLDNNPEYPAIRRVSLKAQAGVSGYAIEYMNEDGPPIVFRTDWYTLHGYKPDKMLALRVAGESMVPSLYPDDLIVVNTAQKEPKDGIAFVVAYEGEIVVKRLVRDDGMWWLTSDNPDQRRYARKICNGGTEIIGEVVYRQTERI